MNARIDSARFKSLTGGDTIPVHLMYKDFHPMTPRFKLFIAAEVFTEKQRNTPSLQGLSRIVMRSSAYTPPT
jgi:hypothetical protein